ncbi:MAG: hypothetical protein AAF645_08255 [Myxococcota bacterium]
MRRAVLIAAFALTGCSLGVGEGEVSGVVMAPMCGLEGAYDLKPNFFVSDPFEEHLRVRIQRGGDFEIRSDGILITISDVNAFADNIGRPFRFTGARSDLVSMNFFAHDSCPIDRDDIPVDFGAVEGTITFDALYSPELDEDQLLTSATFADVRLVDRDNADTRFAVLSGRFEFIFNRGRPAQPFP